MRTWTIFTPPLHCGTICSNRHDISPSLKKPVKKGERNIYIRSGWVYDGHQMDVPEASQCSNNHTQ